MLDELIRVEVAFNFCRTSRIFNCKLVLFGKTSVCLAWKVEVAWVDGKYPWSWNSCITRSRRCSSTFLWPRSLSLEELIMALEGVLGVIGERLSLSAIGSWFDWNSSTLKSGPKNVFPVNLNPAFVVSSSLEPWNISIIILILRSLKIL